MTHASPIVVDRLEFQLYAQLQILANVFSGRQQGAAVTSVETWTEFLAPGSFTYFLFFFFLQ